MAMEWKEALQEATPQEVATIVVVSNKLAQDKGKRKIVESAEVEQSYKFIKYPLVEKVAL